MDIKALLRTAKTNGASDLHLVTASPPLIRQNGMLQSINGRTPLSPSEIEEALAQITNQEERDLFEKHKELDFSYSIN